MTMTTERWKEIEELLNAVLELTADKRDAFLERSLCP